MDDDSGPADDGKQGALESPGSPTKPGRQLPQVLSTRLQLFLCNEKQSVTTKQLGVFSSVEQNAKYCFISSDATNLFASTIDGLK